MFRRDRVTLPLVLLLTLVAGVLRFTALDRPPIWGDEAATYGRVCGTYQELLDQLTDSAFTPLHYLTEWWVGKGMPYWGTVAPEPDGPTTKPVFTPTKQIASGPIALTPFALRFVPALAGTLMIPAMYWLARQLFGPRVGLTAALLACFSAYLLVYSRDAKMYSPFWLMVTLHVGCALWWVRSRRALAWAFWVLFGAAMIGLQAQGFYILAIDALIVFTAPRQYWSKFVPLAGLVLWPVVALPWLLYRAWSSRRQSTGPVGEAQGPASEVSQSATIEAATAGHPGLRESPASAVWRGPESGPKLSPENAFRSRWFRFLIWPRLTWRRMHLPVVLGLVAGIALMAAGPVGYYVGFSKKYEQIAERQASQTDTSDLGISWVPRYNADRGLGGHLLYTVSAYLTGWEWPRNYSELMDDPASLPKREFPFVPLDDQITIRPRTLFLLQEATVLLLALLAVGLVPWRRAFSPVRARLDRMRQTNRVWPDWRRRRVLWVTIWGLALPWAVYTQSFNRPLNPLDAWATVTLKQPADVTWPRARWYAGPATDPAAPPLLSERLHGLRERLARSWADATTGWPAAWAKYRAAFSPENLRTGAVYGIGAFAVLLIAFVVWKRRQVGRGALTLTGVVLVAIVLGTLMTLLPRFVDANVWMPRYLGAALPALIVGAAVLIDRQPRGLRWATIVVFLLANMGQYAGRVWADTEPRADLMAADVVASQPKSKIATHPEKPSFRAYFWTPFLFTPEPGGGTLFSSPGRYYLRLYSGLPSPARAIRGGFYEDNLLFRRASLPAHVVNDIKKAPEVTRFVVWQTLDVNDKNKADPVADQLKGQFRRVSEETWTARDHWRWVERFQVRRRTYERITK